MSLVDEQGHPIHAQADPAQLEAANLKLQTVLAVAYMKVFMLGHPRPEAIGALKEALKDDILKDEAAKQLAKLAEIVRARSIGERCGDHISKEYLELLMAAV
jgi:hypothetical protein